MSKINSEDISNSEKDIFGPWIKDDNIKNKYNNNPFGHIIIDNFLNEEYADKVFNCFPDDYKNWWKYNNPLEVKFANDEIHKMHPKIKNIFYALSSDEIIKKFSEITRINNLEYDKYLHGAGLHVHPRNGRLNMHLDYEKHPISGKERRLNIILYLSKNWKEEWNGDTQLWDQNMEKCIVKSHVKFNTAIIFETNNLSWHGLPEKIICPEGVFRKTLAYYYVSDLTSKSNTNKYGSNVLGFRTKAAYRKRPTDLDDNRLDLLYKIRPYRRITNEDLNKIWPEWNSNDY